MNYRMMTVAALLVALPACAQKKKAVINDSNTPLHTAACLSGYLW